MYAFQPIAPAIDRKTLPVAPSTRTFGIHNVFFRGSAKVTKRQFEVLVPFGCYTELR